MNWKKTGLIAGAVALAGAAGWWFFLRPSGSGNVDLENAAYVTRISDMQGGMVFADRFSGVVEAQETINVQKDQSRDVEELYVEAGQTVMKDQALFRYDVQQTENKITACNLDIEGVNNEINALNGEINELAAQRDKASNDNKLEYTTLIQQRQLQVRQQQYELKSKQAELERLKNDAANATVYSTIAGTVKAINEDGGYDNLGNQLPYISITQLGEYRIAGKISEQSMGTIMAGQPVIVRSRADETKTWSGTVDEVGTEPVNENQNGYYYDGGGEKASKYPFYVKLDNMDGLMLGQHVLIEPDYGQANMKSGIWLDMSFIAYDDNGNPYVWAANKRNKLEKRAVTLGETDEDMWQVEITSGLSESDMIAFPDDSLSEGMDVITPEAMQNMNQGMMETMPEGY